MFLNGHNLNAVITRFGTRGRIFSRNSLYVPTFSSCWAMPMWQLVNQQRIGSRFKVLSLKHIRCLRVPYLCVENARLLHPAPRVAHAGIRSPQPPFNAQLTYTNHRDAIHQPAIISPVSVFQTGHKPDLPSSYWKFNQINLGCIWCHSLNTHPLLVLCKPK